MKKIIFMFLVLLSCISVKAESFYEDNWINGVYVTYEKDDFTKSQLMRFIRKSDGTYSYCLTPNEFLYDTSNYSINNQKYVQKINRLSLLAYYGYGYKNHTSDEWYAITQYLIWEEMDPTSNLYWTDSFKGNKITRFTNEINELNNLVSNHFITPNIDDLVINKGEKTEIIDSNNVLNEYDVLASPDLNIKKENNKLIINPVKGGNYTITFTKKMDRFNKLGNVYTTTEGQDILEPGNFNDVNKFINVNVISGNLEITKYDSKTNSTLSSGYGSLIGAKYNLYDSNNNLVDTLIIGDDYKAYSYNLKYGDYTLKEIEAPMGYKLDDKIYNITINNDYNYLTLTNDIIESDITITKYKNNSGNLEIEEGTYFDFYTKDNVMFRSEQTDNNGKINVKLPYGEYYIKQSNTPFGYKRIDDLWLVVNDSNKQEINLINEKIKSNLRIFKVDQNGNKIITSEAVFKIKNLDTNEYVLSYIDGNWIDEFKTKEGIISIQLEGGRYLIEEISSPKGYLKGENYEISIDEYTPLDEENNLDIYICNIKIEEKENPHVLNNLELEDKNNFKKNSIKLKNDNIELKNNNFVYPKTSNKDIYIETIFFYLLFLISILIISKVKNEK